MLLAHVHSEKMSPYVKPHACRKQSNCWAQAKVSLCSPILDIHWACFWVLGTDAPSLNSVAKKPYHVSYNSLHSKGKGPLIRLVWKYLFCLAPLPIWIIGFPPLTPIATLAWIYVSSYQTLCPMISLYLMSEEIHLLYCTCRLCHLSSTFGRTVNILKEYTVLGS